MVLCSLGGNGKRDDASTLALSKGRRLNRKCSGVTVGVYFLIMLLFRGFGRSKESVLSIFGDGRLDKTGYQR